MNGGLADAAFLRTLISRNQAAFELIAKALEEPSPEPRELATEVMPGYLVEIGAVVSN